jgi:phospholipid/cholesterol/gamma-HCH transport system substrate-binding protein
VTRRVKLNLAFFTAVAAAFGWWAVTTIFPVDAVARPYRISAELASSLGMQPGNEVTHLGVHYGSVASIRRIPGGVLVTMKIDRDKRVPAGATAHLFRKSAVGEPYVELSPPPGWRGSGPWMAAGERIPMSRTTVPLEFSELLRSASRLIEGIPPDAVRTLVHELAVGLEGRAESLRQLVEAGDTIAATLAARTDALDRLATDNTRLARVVAAHRGSLGASLGDLRAAAERLRAARGDLARLLDTGAPFLRRTADVVAASKGNLDCALGALEAILDETTTDRRLEQLRTLLRTAPEAFAGVWDSRDVEPDGVWVRIGTVANTANPAPQYAPPRQLPAVPEVRPCTSRLQPVAVAAARPAAALTTFAARGGLALGMAAGLAAVAVAVARPLRPLRFRAR